MNKSRVRALGVAVLKRVVWLRLIYRFGRRAQRQLVFRWQSRGGTDRALVVFESFNGRSYAGSPRALYEAMLRDPRFARCRFVWALREPGRSAQFPALDDPRTEVVHYRTTPYYRAFGTARVWISNSIIAPEMSPRADQVYLQTWHGTPLKRIGLDVVATTETAMNGKAEIDDRYREEAVKISRFLSSAPFTTEAFATAFGLPAEGERTPFVETGQPRNDVLVNAGASQVAAARTKLRIEPGTKVILYAPTWRDDQHDSRSGYVYTQPLDIARLHKTLGDGWLLLFRAHYLVTNTIDFAGHGDFVRDVSGVDDINDLCLASDVLITDYSSIYFDYALLDRPMLFFMYDLARYASALRGFYLPVEDVPGPVVRDQDELEAALLAPDLGAAERPRRAELVARLAPHDDGCASTRVLDLLAPELSV
ncbi:CDP-glycerol glycerophosphotransferase family protein [uncultured Jatrophihabitans sp.]|uniref:CDP-glycerol glycerophosphotransferase family protein n=1 Tax=uncultured Jatrophihabitans sp. TaxID=1610747 RepID=UPI0035CC6B87